MLSQRAGSASAQAAASSCAVSAGPAPDATCSERKPRLRGTCISSQYVSAGSVVGVGISASLARASAPCSAPSKERPQMCVSTPSVMWTESAVPGPSLPLGRGSVCVVCGKPAGTYKTSPGSSRVSRRGALPISSSERRSLPLPRARGSAIGFPHGAGGEKTRQCFDPAVCSTKTSCLSVCGGAEVWSPRPLKRNVSRAATHTAASLGMCAPAELKTTLRVLVRRAARFGDCRHLPAAAASAYPKASLKKIRVYRFTHVVEGERAGNARHTAQQHRLPRPLRYRKLPRRGKPGENVVKDLADAFRPAQIRAHRRQRAWSAALPRGRCQRGYQQSGHKRHRASEV
eukprot:scaffold14440_cov143-Isochrysis_galbana.AAC.5